MGHFGYYYPDRSAIHKSIRAHYRKRGVTSERKLDALAFRWIRSNGYRAPCSP